MDDWEPDDELSDAGKAALFVFLVANGLVIGAAGVLMVLYGFTYYKVPATVLGIPLAGLGGAMLVVAIELLQGKVV